MANVAQSEEGRPANFRERLAVAVRSIQWSYAIFWSLSTTKKGVLEWSDGYYNGDIKTRKMVQVMDCHGDKLGLERSEQLRELYGSLLGGETEQQAKRPSAALSPEDLTDAEWYYLVCMSFVFNPGQSLPGRALATGQAIWLCDAHHADSKVFSRSLLAKSAWIQTVACFPHLGGVVELGATDLVLEDPSLIQHIKMSLLELSKPICSEISSFSPQDTDEDEDSLCPKVDHEIVNGTILDQDYNSKKEDTRFDSHRIAELHGNVHNELNLDSPLECSNGFQHNHLTEDSFMRQGLNCGPSHVQSLHFVDDDFSNGAQDSINSSDCISQAFVNQEYTIFSPKQEKVFIDHRKELEPQDCACTKINTLDPETNDALHYERTVSAVLKNPNGLLEIPCLHRYNCKSSFVNWRKCVADSHGRQEPQRMLKKILFAVPLMHGFPFPQETSGKEFLCELVSDDSFDLSISSDRSPENDRFLILGSMVPSVSKIDKSSILSNTIEYLKELEARVEELESHVNFAGSAAKGSRRICSLMVEQTSDNYDESKTKNGKPSINKRKAIDIDATKAEFDKIFPKATLQTKVSIDEQEVLVEMSCPWREYLLMDIMDATNNMHLDPQTVQSSILDGVLNLTLKAKFRGASIASMGMIKEEIGRAHV